MSALELNNVSFSYSRGNQVLSCADFNVQYGEITLLAGASGEGKSTVIGLLCGIIPWVISDGISGDITVDGTSAEGKTISELCRKVSVVLQNAESQIFHQTVEDEIAFGCENFAFSQDEISKQIASACELMRLQPFWRTVTLSGGQKQRLITASALALGRKIIILDEPLANLDKDGTRILMNALRELAKSGCAVLIAEHRLDTVMPYADTVWEISGGKTQRITDKSVYLGSRAEIISDSDICTFDNIRTLGKNCIKAENVMLEVKGNAVINGVTLDVYSGEKLLLLGENGCGKTSLLRIIARLQKLSGGSVTQFIDPALKQKAKGGKAWFKRVGVVYQNPNYQLFMPSVESEVRFNAYSPQYAEEIIRIFQIEHLRARHPHSLSEGQKRRVSIAAVVARKPDLLILDEPTVGQDYASLKSLVAALNQIHAQTGNTMITATHDMRCAQALCDRAVVLVGGKLRNSGDKLLVRDYFLSGF